LKSSYVPAVAAFSGCTGLIERLSRSSLDGINGEASQREGPRSPPLRFAISTIDARLTASRSFSVSPPAGYYAKHPLSPKSVDRKMPLSVGLDGPTAEACRMY
jgi:hypothetical protein